MSDSPWHHPRPLFALVAVAACESFAYYAARSQFVTELGARLGDHEAIGRALGLLTFSATLVALLAGIAVDLGGARRMAIAGGVLMGAGLLALMAPFNATLYAGLGLVVAGRGLAHIGVLAVVGDLYAPGDHRGDAGFTLAFFGINLGGALGPLGAGMMAVYVAGEAGFGAAAAVALLGALVLALRRPAHEQPVSAGSWPAGRAIGTLAVLVLCVTTINLAMETASLIAVLSAGGPPMMVDPDTELVIAVLAFAVGVLLVPLLAAWLWLRLGPRQPSSPAKILLGAVLTAAGLLLFAAVPLDHTTGPAARSMWHGTRGLLAEILVAPIALSLISRMAPPRLRGTALGLWQSSSLLIVAYAFSPLQRALFATDLALTDLLLPGIALAAGAAGYALFALLGLTRK